MLLSQALADFDVGHEEFARILDEKNKYEEIKENIDVVLNNEQVVNEQSKQERT